MNEAKVKEVGMLCSAAAESLTASLGCLGLRPSGLAPWTIWVFLLAFATFILCLPVDCFFFFFDKLTPWGLCSWVRLFVFETHHYYILLHFESEWNQWPHRMWEYIIYKICKWVLWGLLTIATTDKGDTDFSKHHFGWAKWSWIGHIKDS